MGYLLVSIMAIGLALGIDGNSRSGLPNTIEMGVGAFLFIIPILIILIAEEKYRYKPKSKSRKEGKE